MTLSLPTPLTRTSLTATDEDLLCGRDEEVRTILLNCEACRLTVVNAAPGLGISSLLRAGAVPALQRAGFVTVVYADWQGRSVGARLRSAVTEAIQEQADGSFSSQQETLRDLLARAKNRIDKPIAILLDQFEDYLRFHSGTDISDDFDAELANAVSARIGRFVIGIQAGSLASFQRLSQYIPNLLGYALELAPLNPETARELLRNEASQAEMAIEPAAIEQIITAPRVIVAPAAGIHPLFAKLAADRLFAAESNLKSKVARASTLAANNGPDTMILESLDPSINDLGSTHDELLFRWIPLLVAPDGRRQAATEKALVDHAGKWNRFAATLLLILVQGGLLRKMELLSAVRYEFTRDSIALIIHDWWQRREATIVARQRARFRTRSISIALGAIVTAYIVYLVMSWKHS